MGAFLIGLLTLALTGCASPVLVDYQHGTSFAGYSSYAFAGSDGPRSLDAQRIRSAVKPRMKARGLELVEPDQADLLLHYRIKETRRVETRGFAFGFGYGHDNVGLGLGTGPDVYEVREGRLILELEDRATGQVVWRAESRRDLNPDLTGEKRRERIEELVGEMLEKFPPEVEKVRGASN